ncbi:MAG: hypothetical protein A2804_00380 [Candidatus Pacebacteria bacterium RIFCSPHIGHO2_01_FULL_46_10]|nr:MAG: hypothetical protein A2804_00380 [Candidatus Pacebacteria bacterium RIFCSPHIGHO2_01_FULL_46_10]
MSVRPVDAREVTIIEGMSLRDMLSAINGLSELDSADGKKRISLAYSVDYIKRTISEGRISHTQVLMFSKALSKACGEEKMFHETSEVVALLMYGFNQFVEGMNIGAWLDRVGRGKLGE